RPLNARGRAAAGAMRVAMRELGLAPDLVLMSSSRRTVPTLEAVEPWDDTPLVETMEALYLAEPKKLFAALRGVPETVRSVLLVGHNPGLHDLAVALVGPAAMSLANAMTRRLSDGYPTGTLVEFVVSGPWRDLGE